MSEDWRPEQALSGRVSELAEKYDPEFAHDGLLVRAALQGVLAGTAARSELISVDEVECPRDGDGNYVDYFLVTTTAGHRFRVSVTTED